MAFETILIAAGTGLSAYSSLYQGAAGEAAAEYNVALANRNARIARDQAAADAEDKARENRRYLGALHAAFGASGLAMEGSFLDVYEDQATDAALAEHRIRYSGELRAAGYEAEAELERMKGEVAGTAAYLGAGAEVAKGAGLYAHTQRLRRAASRPYPMQG